MSETDSFIQEVTEEVRQDRMFALWKKWAPAILGGVALIVAAAAGWTWMQAQEQAEAEARGGTFLAADPSNTEHQIALPDRIDGPARLIAELTAAAALAEDGRTDEAGEKYAAIAGQSGIPQEYADLARLQAVRLGATDDAMADLGTLAEPGRPFRLLALEQRAALLLEAGDVEGAHEDLNTIIADPGVPAALLRRAVMMLTVSGGEVASADG